MENELEFNRRNFVKFLGGGAVAAANIGVLSSLNSCAGSTKEINKLPFRPIDYTNRDDLVLAEGFEYSVVISEGDKINGNELFGANNDYTAVTHLNSNEIILWVNNEYPTPLFVSGWTKGKKRTKRQVDLERASVGGSIVHLKREGKGKPWKFVADSKYNRRIDGTAKIPLIAPRPVAGGLVATGTLGNCAGGVTPWGTILTCEENYQDYYGERARENKVLKKGRLGWDRFYKHPPEHYGWVVEVNVMTGEAKKLTALGRFAHESATAVKTKDGRVAVYSGDDKKGEFLYKFLSDKKDSLETGELFVADVKNGKWVSMDIEKQPILKKNFKDQLDVLIHCREAGRLLGATKLDRPEDIEIHPFTGDVYLTLTNNKNRGNYHGSIFRLRETNGDYASMTFSAGDFLVGGRDFSCPDNLAFDKNGNLWMVTDMSGSAMNKPPYSKFKNNGLFFIPTAGKLAGQVFQVASAPTHAEITGLSWDEDHETLFVAVQHPGEKSKSLKKLTSHWPNGGTSRPKSSVVQISGKALSDLTS